MTLKCGIVGLPNVGKSTLFNAVTSSSQADAANYPFCTIEPNIGRVSVPDERLKALAKIAGSSKIIPAQIEFVDIAGLVKGASKGEGLGNQFLAHIREVDAIAYVLRCFENSDITHVEGDIHPLRDAEIIETELILADIQSLAKQLPNIEKKAKQDKELRKQLDLISEILKVLDEGKPARVLLNDENHKEIKMLNLLTSKPFFYVCNVDEKDIATGNQYTEEVEEYAKEQNTSSIIISAKIEEEIANLEEEEEKKEFIKDMGIDKSGLEKLIATGYSILGLITYFTVGPNETHAWTIKEGIDAQKAAGVIHTDFEKGFICAETISYKDYIEYKDEVSMKAAGKIRQEGKDYVVKDGDIILFRFNVTR